MTLAAKTTSSLSPVAGTLGQLEKSRVALKGDGNPPPAARLKLSETGAM